MDNALITPTVARWARERSGASHTQLADKLRVTPEQIGAWEKGASRPSFRKAQELAKALRIPFGFLFLSKPPVEQTPIPDLRTVEEGRTNKLSPDFMELLNEVLVKQQWYREYVQDREAKSLDFVGSVSTRDGVNTVVAEIKKVVRIDDQLRRTAGSWDGFLRLLVRSAERSGILVMRSGIVGGNTHRPLSVSEFRGFAVADNFAPLVFINGRDAKTAQIFTLAHEVAHVFIGESGISNPDPSNIPNQDKGTVEAFCNSVAAEFLVPGSDFIKAWDAGPRLEDEKAQELARKYRVSTMVILRRALELHRVRIDQFLELVRIHKKRQKELEDKKAEEEKGGGNFYNTLPVRNSAKLTDAVLSASREGSIMPRDAARMLGVKASTLPKLYDRFGS